MSKCYQSNTINIQFCDGSTSEGKEIFAFARGGCGGSEGQKIMSIVHWLDLPKIRAKDGGRGGGECAYLGSVWLNGGIR